VYTPALPRRRFFSRRALLFAAAAVAAAVVVGAAGAGLVWLKTYAPLENGSSFGGLSQGRQQEGVRIEPAAGSEGIPVFFPRYRPHGLFHVMVTLRNRGRFVVTVLGLAGQANAPPFRVLAAEASPPNDYGGHLRPLDGEHPLRLAPGDERAVTLTYRIMSRCIGGQPAHYWRAPGTTSGGRLAPEFRIKYARYFERTQSLETPFAVALACARGVTSPIG
jgi:hypothetical protein